MLVGALLLVLQGGCTNETGALEEPKQFAVDNAETISDVSVREAIVKYYSAESRGDWQVTYGFRSRDFKRLVSFDIYRSEMAKGMVGWQLRKVEIIDYAAGKSKATVRIRFHEKFDSKVAQSVFGGNVSDGVSRRIEDTLWEKVDGQWICVDAGQRGHLPLNHRMIYN
jgi:hypothetical protein